MNEKKKLTVAVAMSGGVDSLRTIALLREEGHEVFGIHMRLLPSSQNGKWCAETFIRTQEERLHILASRLGIPLIIVDIRESFEELVIQPFLKAYREGLTPNPCVLCNPKIKFGLLSEKAREQGADRLATGHYVRLSPPDSDSERFRLYRASDLSKDQSYFLYGLTQDQLSRVLFPLGTVSKEEVVLWAETTDMNAFLTEESQEICFIPSGHYIEFLRERMEDSPFSAEGPIVDMEGRVLGRHHGIFGYTVGQRRGLGIASTAPYYVIALEPATNTVRIGRAQDLYRTEFKVNRVNWVSIPPPEEPLHVQVRIRNQHRPAPAWVTVRENGEALVRSDEPQRAVTPGQAAVFYEGDLLLGGGVIVKA